MSEVLVLAARRTAVAPRGGAFGALEPFALAAPVISALLEDAGLAAEAVDEVILGNALSGGGNVARVAALAAGLPEPIPAVTLDTQCCAGLDAIRLGAARIAAGEAELVIAGGVESFSRAPLRAVRPRAPGEAPRFYDRPPFTPWPDRDPDLTDAAAALARQRAVARTAQEAFAIASHAAALAHADAARSEIVAVAGLAHDAFTRALTPRLAARLPAVAGPTETALTAATIAVEADGAAAVLLGRADGPFAPEGASIVIRGALARGGDPVAAPLAPVEAVRTLLARHRLAVGDLARVELMEAFAVQAMATMADLGLDPARVNAEGGALARGHPIGASGAILAVRLWHQLRRLPAPAPLGLAAIAGAGGLASTLLLQRRP